MILRSVQFLLSYPFSHNRLIQSFDVFCLFFFQLLCEIVDIFRLQFLLFYSLQVFLLGFVLKHLIISLWDSFRSILFLSHLRIRFFLAHYRLVSAFFDEIFNFLSFILDFKSCLFVALDKTIFIANNHKLLGLFALQKLCSFHFFLLFVILVKFLQRFHFIMLDFVHCLHECPLHLLIFYSLLDFFLFLAKFDDSRLKL